MDRLVREYASTLEAWGFEHAEGTRDFDRELGDVSVSVRVRENHRLSFVFDVFHEDDVSQFYFKTSEGVTSWELDDFLAVLERGLGSL